MEWIQVLTIIGFIVGINYYFISNLQKHIDRIDTDMKSQGARTDQLYQMFVDLLKERK
jgi:hypothetical protein